MLDFFLRKSSEKSFEDLLFHSQRGISSLIVAFRQAGQRLALPTADLGPMDAIWEVGS